MGDVLTINRTPSDFVSDTQHMTTLEFGAYQRICDQIVIRGQDCDPASLPDDDVMLASIAGLSRLQWRKIKPRLCEGPLKVLTVANGRLTQIRTALEIQQARRRMAGQAEKGRKSGEVRRAKAELKQRFLEPDANTVRTQLEPNSSPSVNRSGTSYESRVMSYEEPSVLKEKDSPTTARARRVTPETEAWLRMKVREIRNDAPLWEIASNDPEEFEQRIRDLTGWSPNELADITGDEALRRAIEVHA